MIHGNCACPLHGTHQRGGRALVDKDVEALDAEIIAANDGDRTSDGRQPAVLEEHQGVERLTTIEGARGDRRGLRTVDPDDGQSAGQILDLHVLAEDELFELVLDGRGGVLVQIDQDPLAGFENPHVRDHAALRGQKCRIAAGARRESRDVVGQQPLEIGQPIAAGKADDPAVLSSDGSGPIPQRVVLFP